MSKASTINIRRLNKRGLIFLEDIFEGREKYDPSILKDPDFTSEAPKFGSINTSAFKSWLDMAQAVIKALKIKNYDEFTLIQDDKLLWGWLSLALWDALTIDPVKFPTAKRWYKETHLREKWLFIPGESGDFWKYQRHLVRTPVHLLCEFEESAHHLLSLSPQYGRGEVFEQLTAKQRYWNKKFQDIAAQLYYDAKKKKIKPGAGDDTNGGARRLNRIFNQFDVTWEMENMQKENYIKKLPKEFDRFK